MLRLSDKNKQTSFYSILYNKIPEDHLLKKIDKAVDFSFVNELLADSYCKDFGRPAKEPEMMFKLNLLETLYNQSDVEVITEGSYNLAYLWFLGLNPEDELPHPSLLAKFRTQRLKDISMDEILTEMVRQCVENGIITGDSIAVDATHTDANCKKKIPERIMKHLAKRIFKGIEKDLGEIPEKIDTAIPDYTLIEDHTEAKEMMLGYLKSVIAAATEFAGPSTKKAIEEAVEVIADEKFLLQKGLRSLYDKDARVGRKSKNESFFGYKTEFMMTTDERIITAVDVYDGAHVDGLEFNSLLERTEASGVKVNEMYGDKAYFRKDILETLEEKEIEDYIPVSASTYKINEELYSYNKDSDEWFCFVGNHTIKKVSKTRTRNGKIEHQLHYTFDKDQCINCPHREECMKKSKAKAKKLVISASTPYFYEKSQRQKNPEYLEKYKKRSAIEWKNAEMKRFHRLTRARGRGLRGMSFQAKITAIAANAKRIAALSDRIFTLFFYWMFKIA